MRSDRRMRRAAGVLAALMIVTAVPAAAEGKGEAQLGLEDVRAMSGGKADVVFREDEALLFGSGFYEGLIHNGGDAVEAAGGVLELLGTNSAAELDVTHTAELRDGTTVYTLSRSIDGENPEGSAVKVIADADFSPAALVSSIGLSKAELVLDDPNEEGKLLYHPGGFSRFEAERMAQKFAPGTTVLSGLTTYAVLPVVPLRVGAEAEGSPESDVTDLTSAIPDRCELVWSVYTTLPGSRGETGQLCSSEPIALVHYLTLQGRYLYALPVEAADLSERLLALENASDEEYFTDLVTCGRSTTSSVKHTFVTGEKKTLTIPVVKDADGNVMLMDEQRGIIAADYDSYVKDGVIEPIRKIDDKWDERKAYAYSAFVKVWDVMKEQGIEGPDGDGANCLLLLYDDPEEVSDDDSVSAQAGKYLGRRNGLEVFAINASDPAIDALDLMGALYARAVTRYAMGGDARTNDSGAIRESLCRILGKLIEISLDPSANDNKWILGTGAGLNLGTMSAPQENLKPRTLWGDYSVPSAVIPTAENEFGGVLTNASVIDYAAYRLKLRGMELQDMLDYWILVMHAVTPATSYPELWEIMTRALPISGAAYMEEALEKLIVYVASPGTGCPFVTDEVKDAGIQTSSKSKKVPEGFGVCVFGTEETVGMYVGKPVVTFYGKMRTAFTTWPERGSGVVTAVLPEDSYYVSCVLTCPDAEGIGETRTIELIWTSDGWREADSGAESLEVRLGDGQVVVLTAEGLEDYALPGAELFAGAFEAERNAERERAGVSLGESISCVESVEEVLLESVEETVEAGPQTSGAESVLAQG